MQFCLRSIFCLAVLLGARGLTLRDHDHSLTDSIDEDISDTSVDVSDSKVNDTSDASMEDMVDSSVNVCELPTALPVAFALSDDDVIERTNNTKQASNAGVPDEKAKREALQEAIVDYKQKKQQYQLATVKLMSAMEALLQVPSADNAALEKVAQAKAGKDTLVVFYAPWCPHCQSFVLHDKNGDPTNAPLEVFRRDLQADASTKNVEVVRADVTKLGNDIPAPFDVQAIPTVYFVNREGEESKFDGNPQNLADLKGFVSGLLSD